jgi:hypothetical protein
MHISPVPTLAHDIFERQYPNCATCHFQGYGKEVEWHGKVILYNSHCFCLIVHDQANDPVCTSPARS